MQTLITIQFFLSYTESYINPPPGIQADPGVLTQTHPPLTQVLQHVFAQSRPAIDLVKGLFFTLFLKQKSCLSPQILPKEYSFQQEQECLDFKGSFYL